MLLDPGPLDLHSAIAAAIIWKPSIAAIAQPFSNMHYLCHALLFQCIFAGGYSRLQSLLTIRRLIVSKQM